MVIDLFGIVLFSFLLLVIAGAAYGCWWLMETRDKQQNRKSRAPRRRKKPLDRRGSARVPIDLKPLDRTPSRSGDNSPKRLPGNLRAKLLKMVGNDTEIEERLIKNLQEKHPDKDLVWCYEKAIFDLERDRGI